MLLNRFTKINAIGGPLSRFSLALSSLFAATCANAASSNLALLSLDELMEVEVTTPGKVPEAIRDTPSSVLLIGRDEIETFGYTNLTEALESVPGFYNIDNYNGVSGNFGVRGFWNARSQNSSLAILVNGVPQMRPDLLATPMEGLNVPIEAIDRIEVSRGPNSVIYGNGAFFGAINIITDGSYSDDQVSVSTGANGTHRVAGRVSEFGDDYHLIFNAGYSETDGYDYDLLDMVGSERAALLPSYGVEEGNTSLAGRLEQKTGFLQLSGEWRQLYFDYTFNDSDVEAFSGYPAVEEGNLRSSQNTRFALGADMPLSDSFRLDTKLMYQSYSSEEDYDALSPDFFGINTREFDNWELESLLTYQPNSDFSFLVGLNLQRLENFYEYTHVPAVGLLNEAVVIDSRDIRSLFTQLSYQVSEPLRIVAGYRVEEMGDFKRFVFQDEPIDGEPLPGSDFGGFKNGTPRLSFIYQPSESQVIKFMIGDAIKIPNFNSTGFDTERIRTSEINYTWSKESFIFSASAFRNSMNDLIIQTLDINSSGLVDTDLLSGGEVDTNGLEVLARNKFSDIFQAEIGVTVQESEDSETPEGLLSYSPDWVAHGKLSFHKEDFTFSVTGRFVDAMTSFYNVGEDVSSRIAREYFGDPVDGHFVTDLNLRWDDVFEGVYLNVHVTNVFDTEIRYPNNPINGLFLDRGSLGPGRQLSLKAGVRF